MQANINENLHQHLKITLLNLLYFTRKKMAHAFKILKVTLLLTMLAGEDVLGNVNLNLRLNN